jgi:aspartyl protease family protein
MLSVILIGVLVGFALPNGKTRAVTPAPPALAEGVEVARETVIERRPNGHFSTVAEVNGEPIHFVVDTGADTVALTLEDARQAHVTFDPAEFEIVASGASGPVRGQEVMLKKVSLDGKKVEDIRAVVLEGLDVSLLGQNYLRHLDTVSISGDRMTLR